VSFSLSLMRDAQINERQNGAKVRD
jgi:hypothetical protein